MKNLPSETLYRKAGRKYVPVHEYLDYHYRFPQGRWVLTVEPGKNCCLNPLPNVDDALVAALHAFRWDLEEEVAKALAPAWEGGRMSKDDRETLEVILNRRHGRIVHPAVGTAVLNAIEKFAEKVARKE